MITHAQIHFLGGKKLSQLMPFLKIVAKQNNLRLNRVPEFQKAVRIFAQSRYKN